MQSTPILKHLFSALSLSRGEPTLWKEDIWSCWLASQTCANLITFYCTERHPVKQTCQLQPSYSAMTASIISGTVEFSELLSQMLHSLLYPKLSFVWQLLRFDCLSGYFGSRAAH